MAPDRDISARVLRSVLVSAASLAAETELVVDFAREGRSTPQLGEGHLKYLASEGGPLSQRTS